MIKQQTNTNHEQANLSKSFVGLILLPIIGNAVEHITAITVAMKVRGMIGCPCGYCSLVSTGLQIFRLGFKFSQQAMCY